MRSNLHAAGVQLRHDAKSAALNGDAAAPFDSLQTPGPSLACHQQRFCSSAMLPMQIHALAPGQGAVGATCYALGFMYGRLSPQIAAALPKSLYRPIMLPAKPNMGRRRRRAAPYAVWVAVLFEVGSLFQDEVGRQFTRCPQRAHPPA
uniref:Uncharacterized protein n=1 Tax=Bionectria ochroleuca TaxID=29856 RepID=A0A8H7NEV1_BIOOC